jgi:sigma-B regulation protein RsbU (phosphoserine phosphatase)
VPLSALVTPGDPKLEQLRKLSDIGRAFTYTTTLEQVTRLTVDRGADLVGAVTAVIMMHDDDGLLHVRAAHGVADEKVNRFRAPLSDEIIGRLRGLLDVTDDCFIAVPLVVGGSVSGLLAAGFEHPPADSDEWVLSALADQAAVALENARLSGEVRLEMESRLRASEGATSAKDRALATLAHDIRSPLGAINGYCEILSDGLYGPINDKQRDALARVQMSGRHLLSLLDNVMDMARLSAGVAGVRDEAVDLRAVAREAVEIMTPAAYAKRQQLILASGDPIIARGDVARSRQVLVNLIGNAVKFTPEKGLITVAATRVHEHDAMHGEVRVTDTGPGIAEAEQAAVFEAYYRSEGTAAAPGIGLGLAISQALVSRMGGELRVESAPGAGASFMVRLPVRSGRAEAGAGLPPEARNVAEPLGRP